MNIFLLNYILMLIASGYYLYRSEYSRSNNTEFILQGRKRFVIVVCLLWILISGLRADTVGNDTLNYMRNFDIHKDLPWSTVFTNFYKYYIEGDESQYFEPGFVLFERLVGIFVKSHEGYKFVVAIIFMGSMGRFVYKNSEDPFLSFLLYDGLFYNMFSLTGYRQVISVSIGILWAYDFLKERKPVKFFLLVLLASTIHKSTLFFGIFYFVSQKKIEIKYVGICAAVIAVMIVARNQIFMFVKGLVGYDQYGVEGGFTQANFLFMFSVLTALCTWRYSNVIEEHPEARVYYNALIMSWFMVPFAMVSPTSMRLVYDFGFQLMFLLPLVVKSFPDKKERTLIYIAVVLVFAYFIAVKTPPYMFFWEDEMRFYR